MQTITEAKRSLERKDLSINIRCAIMKSNVDELPELVEKAADWGVDKILFNYLYVANEIDPKESLYYTPERLERPFAEALAIGANRGVKIVMPERSLRNAIVAAFVMVFVFTLGAYLLPQILCRPRRWTLSVLITDAAIYQTNMPLAAALA